MLGTLRILNELERAGFYARWALGGAMGLNYYIDPVETHVLDVFVMLAPATGTVLSNDGPLLSELRRRGFPVVMENVVIAGIPVQFIDVGDALECEALEQAVEVDFKGEQLRVVLIEHLMAMSVKVGRPKDKLRLARVLCEHPDRYSPGRLYDILARHGLLARFEKLRRDIGA